MALRKMWPNFGAGLSTGSVQGSCTMAWTLPQQLCYLRGDPAGSRQLACTHSARAGKLVRRQHLAPLLVCQASQSELTSTITPSFARLIQV